MLTDISNHKGAMMQPVISDELMKYILFVTYGFCIGFIAGAIIF
jgi:hypothetical protein